VADEQKRYRIEKSGKVLLKRFDAGAKPFVRQGKATAKLRVKEQSEELALVQDRFYALRKDKVLLILQGMDTSGKDGTIRAVFQAVDPLGVRAVSYRAPTEPEKDRDFLWRHHRDVPGKGEIVIFNRSHYEAVLIEYVHGWIDDNERQRRLHADGGGGYLHRDRIRIWLPARHSDRGDRGIRYDYHPRLCSHPIACGVGIWRGDRRPLG